MKECRPSITISTIFKLAKHHFREFKNDVSDFNKISKISCDTKFKKESLSLVSPEVRKAVMSVQEIAAEKFDPDKASEFPDLDEDFKYFCKQLKKEIKR
jgi:hypothetical protein